MSRYELTIVTEFAAAHRLRLYDGSMEPLHGHNWRVEAFIEADRLDEMEIVADFTVLRPRLEEAVSSMRDAYLNELSAFSDVNPTTERVAQHVFEAFEPGLPAGIRLTRVRVWETAGCAASYSRASE